MPSHHEVVQEDVDLKRLGGVLATAYESQPKDFESLLLTPGLGPRTLQSLALVSEVIYGTPSRFTDPARLIAPPYKRNFSVRVVLPASGCDIIAKVLLLFISFSNDIF